MRAYVNEDLNGLYTLSKDKQPDSQEIEISNKDKQELLAIPMGHMTEIQQLINKILYSEQQKLPYDNGKRDNADV